MTLRYSLFRPSCLTNDCFCVAAPSRLFRIGGQLPEPTRRKRSGRCYSPSGGAINVCDVIGCFSPAPRQSGDLDFGAIARRKLPADFSRSPFEILGGPQSRFPHPVGSGALGVDPMPGGKLFQSFDCFQRVSDIDKTSGSYRVRPRGAALRFAAAANAVTELFGISIDHHSLLR
jgi:hypothetical protein